MSDRCFMKIMYLLLLPAICFSQSLKILSVNVWSGLDYKGFFKCGEYESEETREKRFNLLAESIRELAPDIIYLQEVNPAGGYSSRIANLLGYDEIHHVCNSGIKIIGLGIPVNLNDGIAILASPELQLQKYDVWKLSGPFGLYGGAITLHFSEANFALVGKILYNNVPFLLINTHLSDFPPSDSLHKAELIKMAVSYGLSSEALASAVKKWEERIEKKKEEFAALEKHIEMLDTTTAYILGGDFNCLSEERLFKDFTSKMKLIDCGHLLPDRYTWDPVKNENIKYSAAIHLNGDGYSILNSVKDQSCKRLDYLLVSHHFQNNEIKEYDVVLDSRDEVNISDHYGIMAAIDMKSVIREGRKESIYFQSLVNSSIEPFPILMYDTDIGLGYGAKAFFLNTIGFSESFDLLAFNSSKGERWYRFSISLPDIETRQGKVYPLGIDLTADYDKLIKHSFFGTGSESGFDDCENYTKQTLDFSLSLNRGFSQHVICEAGARYKSVSSTNLREGGLLSRALNNEADKVNFYSLFAGLRYDSRDSFINPSDGMVIQAEVESSVKELSVLRTVISVQNYNILFYPKTILATRLSLKSISGDVPIQLMLPLGGNNTLRGYPQDRFLDKCLLLFNGELRFPVYWKFGGLVGLDAGKVFSALSAIDLNNYKYNFAAGIRFYMENFVVRLDAGFSEETMGLYFNFGHIF